MTRAAIWQPMKTAPRDGTIVDLHLTGGGRYTDAWWEEEDGTWCGLEEEMFNAWAPLPRHPISTPEPPPALFYVAVTFWVIFAFAVIMAIGSWK